MGQKLVVRSNLLLTHQHSTINFLKIFFKALEITIVEFSRHTIGPDSPSISLIGDNPSWPDIVLKNYKWNTDNKSPKFQSLKYCTISFSPSVLCLFLHITMTHTALQNYDTCASIEFHLRVEEKFIDPGEQEKKGH